MTLLFLTVKNPFENIRKTFYDHLTIITLASLDERKKLCEDSHRSVTDLRSGPKILKLFTAVIYESS